MNTEEIMKKGYPQEVDQEYVKKMARLRKRHKKIIEELGEHAGNCAHPAEHIAVESTGYQDRDGYGDLDYVYTGHRASCKLCGAHEVGKLNEDDGTGFPAIHVENFKKVKEKIRLADIKWHKEYKEEQERKQLKKLLEKYGDVSA